MLKCEVSSVIEAQQAAALRILLIGTPDNTRRIAATLTGVGHTLVLATDLGQAVEALVVKRFDAVLLTPGLPASEIAEFSAAVRELDQQPAGKGVRTPILSAVSGSAFTDTIPPSGSGIDRVVAESIDPDALTLAIARLASAVGPDKDSPKPQELAPELAVLDVDELKEQVAYDSELLIELIDLYFSERARQSQEMAAALAAGDCDQLSRIAHTIKGSLGSLHADAARSTAQALELAARNHDTAKCHDFLPYFEQQLDQVENQLRILKHSLSSS